VTPVGRVVAVVRVLPEDVETPPEEIIDAVKRSLPPTTYEVMRARAEPLAYGINAIYLWVIMPEDIEGGTEDLEQRLMRTPGVSQVDVVSVSRLIE